METVMNDASRTTREARLDHRLNDVGWGLLLMLTGAIWLLPNVPAGTWLFGVAAILLGVNVARYASHIAVSGFSVVLGLAALVAAFSQVWRTDAPLLAIVLIAIGAGLVIKPLFTRTA
jgi:hypothetical protein